MRSIGAVALLVGVAAVTVSSRGKQQSQVADVNRDSEYGKAKPSRSAPSDGIHTVGTVTLRRDVRGLPLLLIEQQRMAATQPKPPDRQQYERSWPIARSQMS